MRPSCNRHVLSVLRRELGMNQSDFAWLVGCSASHIQAVEIRRLPLTERVAMRIFAETGVSPDWLLANDFNRPMIEGGNGVLYTKACYERMQAKKHSATAQDTAAIDDELMHVAAMLWSVMSAAQKKGTVPASMALFRVGKFVDEMMAEFGIDFWVYDGKNRARAPKVISEKVVQAKQWKQAGDHGRNRHPLECDASPKFAV